MNKGNRSGTNGKLTFSKETLRALMKLDGVAGGRYGAIIAGEDGATLCGAPGNCPGLTNSVNQTRCASNCCV